MRRVFTIIAAAALLAGCTATPEAAPSPPRAPSPTPSPACQGHPTPECTGLPPGRKLTEVELNIDGLAHLVDTPGAVLDGVHVKGELVIGADNVTIKNSLIDGQVWGEYNMKFSSFTISDSTVGPAGGCNQAPGVGPSKYKATRVNIRNHSDGFRASGDDIDIRDSYIKLCSNPGDHSDGIQSYKTGKNLVFHHNTIDQRFAKDATAPIFLVDEGQENVTVTDNLVMGGTYSIQVRNVAGRQVVKDNKLVDKSWVYGPVDTDCRDTVWADNTLVRIDENYRITGTVGPLACAGP
ncbi:hypothetical protein DP939_03520 [Spongiactinospora rosea]|uniref:Right handed beta helix domain-containing protein n=1 Tax=Spongiactinospora rosea TaxID=2248750 RepID=A0A366M7G3_9ACTN|nr:right-handed parallel beta-helix repeat-containing protein [Spongiactinospora rosea]RBQ21773.1 hypothetical protein DP939_03520 [Spongiactinospora rosea]